MATCRLKKGEVLILRTSDKNGQGYNGFRWPKKGEVKCPDWDPSPKCGGGLHGLLWGEGDGSLLNWGPDAVWQVVAVPASEVVNIGSAKVKFSAGRVVYSGKQQEAGALILAHAPKGTACVGASMVAGDNGHATAGDNGKATAGSYGHATAGDNGHATAGDNGQATAGYNGHATAGDNGQATAGNYGKATAGSYGKATAGYNGQATAGYNGHATAGNYGVLILSSFDGTRQRAVVAYVGEDGIEPGKAYRLDALGKVVPA